MQSKLLFPVLYCMHVCASYICIDESSKSESDNVLMAGAFGASGSYKGVRMGTYWGQGRVNADILAHENKQCTIVWSELCVRVVACT